MKNGSFISFPNSRFSHAYDARNDKGKLIDSDAPYSSFKYFGSALKFGPLKIITSIKWYDLYFYPNRRPMQRK